MKIQPIDFLSPPAELTSKPAAKSRLKRLLERQFTSVIRISAPPPPPEKLAGDSEPSTACLAKMVQNFIEDSGERPPLSSSSVEDSESLLASFCDAIKAHNSLDGCEALKSLVLCSSVTERNLLADTARIVDRNSKNCKRKDETCKKIVTNGLVALGYDASLCKSRWEKSPSCPGGEYEYIDVMIEGERYLVDVDFRSEFEIARPTKAYKAMVQVLPQIYVGRSERLMRIVTVVSDAAKESLRKKGMPVPPWRRRDYVAAKWLAPHARRVDDPTRRVEGESVAVSRVDEWVSMPRELVGSQVKKKVTAGLASVMNMDD